MFAFLNQVLRPLGGKHLPHAGVSSQLLEKANNMAGHDPRAAAELRSAALAALGVIR